MRKLIYFLPIGVIILFFCAGIFLITRIDTSDARAETQISRLPMIAHVESVPTSMQQSLPTNTPIPAQKKEKKNRLAIAPLFHPNVQQWSKKIAKWSKQYNIDPAIIATIMQIESCGQKDVTSHAGATSLFQVMPYHFQSGENPYDPDTNAMRGIAYIKASLDAHDGDIRLAFAGYNGGITGSKRPENLWAYETQRYVYWAEGIYQDAKKNKKHSDRLDEWMSSGGYSLCNR